MNYVLITPAHNEEAFIEKTIESVISQTRLPDRWIIVDDGSTDRTAEIVRQRTADYQWIELVNRHKDLKRDFAAKVHAFNAGLERVRGLAFDVIGNLDADISFTKDYFEFLLGRLQEDPRLGVAGTPFREQNYDSSKDSFEGQFHVPGGCQLFRRQCFNEVGGYLPNPAGGIDWIAVTTARMKGWKTRSFPERYFFHFRSLGTAGRSTFWALFSYGEKDYYLGGHPLWEFLRVLYRTTRKPYIAGGVAILTGYTWAWIRRIERPVSAELVVFHRREQMLKLKGICAALLRLRRIDGFRTVSEENRSG